jgi:hypothetical protein
MSVLRERLRRLEARQPRPQAPEPPDPVWKAQVQRWLERLLDSMADEHVPLLRAWLEDVHECRHAPCPVPRGLNAHLEIMYGWIGTEGRAIALPPAVVEAYVTGSPATHPNEDCEDCGMLLPSTGNYDRPTEHPFPDCPRCGGWVHWHAWDTKHNTPGYDHIIYPADYKAYTRKRRRGHTTPDRRLSSSRPVEPRSPVGE